MVSFVLICYMLLFYGATLWEILYEIIDLLKYKKEQGEKEGKKKSKSKNVEKKRSKSKK